MTEGQKIKKVGLIYNASWDENLEVIKKIDKFLHEKNINTWIGKTSVEDSNLNLLNELLDFALVLGGDGTLLGASRVLAPKGIPIFGINTGHLGFLTQTSNKDVLEFVEKVLNNEYKIEERTMLSGYIDNQGPLFALNDIVINRGTSYKMIHIALSVDGKPVADYIADGLIISTPTGSTAYALSAGGAVMDPEIHGIEIVPICAHTLTSRPHIISDNKTIMITFNRPHEDALLQLDGQEAFNIKDGTKIKIKRATHTAKLMRLPGKENDFYSVIRKKFHWGLTTY
ncbi:MAG: NAD(+)/NADH kinase [Candidatus Melainabacteria bacterium]|nr:NAD(+)/NADH kinase [Candidatus Melainabacteria bacterium]